MSTRRSARCPRMCARGWTPRIRERLAAIDGVTGVGPDASVTDRIAIGGAPPVVFRQQRGGRFFQGNRYLLNDLAGHVVGSCRRTPTCWIVCAGSGLFSLLAAAAHGRRG